MTDRERAQRMGEAAHRRVREDYLVPRRLIQELDLIEQLAGREPSGGATGRV